MKDQKKLQKRVENLQKQQQQNDKKLEKNGEKQSKTKTKYSDLARFIEGLSGYKKRPDEIQAKKENDMREELLYKPLKESVEDLEGDLDIQGYIYKWTTPEEVIEYVNDSQYDIIDSQAEEIYYANAMEYLKENDPTLTESLELAYNYGYDVKNLNSCILASLHQAEYWWYNEDFAKCIEAMEDKAEEINENRDKIKEETWLDIDEYIEQEAEKFTKEAIAKTWTPEELKKIEDLKAQLEGLRSEEIKIIDEWRKIRDLIEDIESYKETMETLPEEARKKIEEDLKVQFEALQNNQ